MIAQPDAPLLDDEQDIRAARRRSLRIGIAGFVAIFCFGAAVGAAKAAFEDAPPSIPAIMIAAAFALAAVGGLVWVYNQWRSMRTEPEARSVVSARRMLYACGAIGGVIGLLIAVGADTSSGTLDPLADTPLPPLVAAVLVAMMGLVVPFVTWRWHRTIDEHVAEGYRTASLIALYTYFFVSITWWLGARGGFLPAADGKAIFVVTMIVWTAAWIWRRYR